MKWTPATVQCKRIWSEGLFTLKLRAPEVAPFKPGQFLQLGLQLPEGPLYRPYSAASPHGEFLEFFIVMLVEGSLTPRLWKLEAGNEVIISQKAAGGFTLDNSPEGKELWLIGTGTGLAPYIAMLRTDEPWLRYPKIILVHGVRHASDLAYQEEMASYASHGQDRFRYIPVVSREVYSDGLSGRITTCLENGSLEEAAQSKFSKESAILLCGNPDMLDDCESMLGKRGITKHKKKTPGQIVVERYW
jgi:ferredoxin/flavodoxin---NADP+ reductase